MPLSREYNDKAWGYLEQQRHCLCASPLFLGSTPECASFNSRQDISGLKLQDVLQIVALYSEHREAIARMKSNAGANPC